jgi:hypothetical protein
MSINSSFNRLPVAWLQELVNDSCSKKKQALWYYDTLGYVICHNHSQYFYDVQVINLIKKTY